MSDNGDPGPAGTTLSTADLAAAEKLFRLARALSLTFAECEAALMHGWQGREFRRAGHREAILKLDDDGGLCVVEKRVPLKMLRERFCPTI